MVIFSRHYSYLNKLQGYLIIYPLLKNTKSINENQGVMFLEDKTKIRLTAAEISALWMQYVNDTASICINSHFLSKAEDDQSDLLLNLL